MIVLVAASLALIWLFRYIPTQDGPAHLYNSHILREYLNPAYNFQQFYSLRAILIPNLIAHGLLSLFMFIFPPLIAEKVVVSLYVILFPAAIVYLQEAVRPGNRWLALLSFPLIFNYLFLMGFYAFAFAVPVFAIVIGYWWTWKNTLNWRNVLVINALLAILFFCHIVPYVFAVFAILFLSVLVLRSQWHKLAWSAAAVLPSTLLFFNYYIGSNVDATGSFIFDSSRIPDLLSDLAQMKVLVSYDDTQQIFAWAYSVLLLGLVMLTIRQGLGGVKSLRAWLDERGAFLLLLLAMLAAYLMIPWSIGSGAWLNDRLALLISVMLLAWLSTDFSARVCSVGTTLIMLVALGNITWLGYDFYRLNQSLVHFTAAITQVGRNHVILPIFFEPNGKSSRVGIYVNAANYYALENGNINLGNYEVQFDYFPVRFNDNFIRPIAEDEWVQVIHWEPERIDLCSYAPHLDYVMTWGIDRLYPLMKCYQVVFSSQDLMLKLYQPRDQ
jgi:MFS family permease